MKPFLQLALLSPDIVLGGQAVMEGVMMKGKNHAVVSVRKDDGSIARKTIACRSRPKIAKIPILRGAVNLFSVLVLGVKALNWSAEEAMHEEKEEKSSIILWLTLAASLILSIALFVFLPYLLTTLIPGLSEKESPISFNIVDGAIKLGILVFYLYMISRLKDIQRLFEFHGAEHKAVHCYEKKLDLTIENTAPFTTLHPRCGTSFILFVVLVSIGVFSFIPWLLGLIIDTGSLGAILTKAIYFITRVSLLPLVAGVSFEVLRISAKHKDRHFFKMVVAPGLWLQCITTKEPDGKQLEISLDALKQVLALEGTGESVL